MPTPPEPAVIVVDGRQRWLDRYPEHDPANARFLARDLPALRADRPLRDRHWSMATLLDQIGPSCVGHGIAHELNAEPVTVAITERDALRIYRLAQTYDPWWNQAHDGSTVLAGAKAARYAGKWTEYRWCTSIDDVIRTLSLHGPVVLGSDWTANMFRPDNDGLIHPTGNVEGGHCYLAADLRLGSGPDDTIIGGPNSWGRGWSDNGYWWMTAKELGDLLFSRDGEAVTAVHRRGGTLVE